MAEKVLVAMEISKKQNYIFKSNKLKENIGASLIIKYVTEDLWEEFTDIKNKVYSGGGNSYLSFSDIEKAKEFISDMSFHILKNYEGLEFYSAIVEGEFNKDNMDELKNKLASKKLKRQNSFRKVSFGVEEICKSTSTPAIKVIKELKFKNENEKKEEFNHRAVSQEAWIKNAFFDHLNKGKNSEYFKIAKEKNDYDREINFFDKLDKDSDYKQFTSDEFSLDLDEFGEDKNSQIAIVSIDGNKMGDMVGAILKSYDGKDLKNKLDSFSEFIKESYENAFNKVKDSLKENNEKKIPLRPLVLAGDDVTYIVDSKYALESVRIFTESIENANLKDKFPEFNKKLTIGAGVVFVNKKAPFNKAYEMAEDLCKNAKILVDGKSSTIDWHILKGEFDDIDDIRDKANHNKNSDIKEEKELFIRPVKLKSQDDNKLSLAQILSTVDYINDPSNGIRVGKLRELLGVFDEGKTKTDIFINKYRLNEDIKNINNQLGYSEYDRPYKDNMYHLHDILELCNDKYYKSLKAGDE